MIPEDYLAQQQAAATGQSVASGNADLARQEMMLDEANKSMVREQLDLSEELRNIEYLLKGYVKDYDDRGNFKWVEPEDKSIRVLSDYGVQKIMNIISWYINKNTLLSNFDEEIIASKMQDFATSLSDNIFMKYEKFFRSPTLDECKEELKLRIEKKVNIRKFAYEITGAEGFDDLKVRSEIVKEMEPIIEDELEKIRAKLLKDKLKDFDMLVRAVQDAVHATYQRAWKGAERRTIRQHIHVNESINPNFSNNNNEGRRGGLFGMFKR